MPINGPYDFKRAAKAAPNGLIIDENDIDVGEWAWVDYTDRVASEVGKKYLLILIRDPDCKTPATVWRRFGDEVHGHDIDSQGNVKPSILHNWRYGDPPVERCGFHSYPTRLLDFVDIR